MTTKGLLRNVDVDIYERKSIVLMELEARPEELEKLQGKTLSVELKQFREKRTLDANRYYWQLVTKLADAISQSNSWVHNWMLREYGELEVLDGQLVQIAIRDSEAAQYKVERAETYHLKPTSNVFVGNDGSMYRTYYMVRGSSTYNTKEMSRLINGLISECKEVGIETLTPDEIDRMMAAYGEKYNS